MNRFTAAWLAFGAGLGVGAIVSRNPLLGLVALTFGVLMIITGFAYQIGRDDRRIWGGK